MEQDGILHRGEVTADDLLDEVLDAEPCSSSPIVRGTCDWTCGSPNCLHDALEQWVKQEPRKHVSLEEKPRRPCRRRCPQGGREEWWGEVLGDEETFAVGDLMPDVEGTGHGTKLKSEEQMDRLLSLLRELPRAQRQAFLLHALENYDTAEIAMLQDRPESQVKADVEAARQRLRERLLAGGYVQEAGKPAALSRQVR